MRFLRTLMPCVAMFLVTGAYAQKSTVTDVTTIIHNYENDDPAGTLLLTRSDNPLPGLLASYSAAQDSKVKSWFYSSGMYSFFLGSQNKRKLWVTVSPAVYSGTDPLPDSGLYWDSTQIFSECYRSDLTKVSLLTIAPGNTEPMCSLGVDFYSAQTRTKYMLAMSPLWPDTAWATVSCTGGDTSGACNRWSIVPNMTTGPNVFPQPLARLRRFVNHGNPVVMGLFYNTFHIEITRP